MIATSFTHYIIPLFLSIQLESPDLYQFLKSHQPLKTKESTTQVMAIAYKWHSKILVPSKLMALRDKRLKSRSREGEIALSR